jgi:hypothetical protein
MSERAAPRPDEPGRAAGSDVDPDSDVGARREYLSANNGIPGLEVLDAHEIDRAVRIFDRDGFVVVRDVLTPEQIQFLASGVLEVVDEVIALDETRLGNRGSHRYSFGGTSITRSMLHRPEWRMLLDIPAVSALLDAIFGSSDYMVRSASGDFCLPGALGYQPLHSDMGDFVSSERTPFSSFRDRRGHLTTRDLPTPYVCVNFLPFDQTALNGPTRQIPGSQHSRERPPTLDEEPEWMRLSTVCPAPAGAIQVRDVRAWHGGTPNLSEQVRAIPNMEFYAPWFREPTVPCITYDDWRTLSDHARRITRHLVVDSSEELRTGYSFAPLTKSHRE